jgi:hypothetical protein
MLVKGAFTQISGSFGGLTGSHNRGGLYLRARTIPVDPNTIRQVTIRFAMQTLATRWRDVLTPAQRAGWSTYAANTPIVGPLGDPRDVGGFAMYCRGNIVRLQLTSSLSDIVDDAAVSGEPALTSPSGLALVDSTGLIGGTLLADPWVDEDDAYLGIWASRPFSPGRNFWGGPWRLIGSVAGDSTTAPTTISVDWGAVWGSVSAGDKVNIRLRVVDAQARLSAALEQTVVVT